MTTVGYILLVVTSEDMAKLNLTPDVEEGGAAERSLLIQPCASCCDLNSLASVKGNFELRFRCCFLDTAAGLIVHASKCSGDQLFSCILDHWQNLYCAMQTGFNLLLVHLSTQQAKIEPVLADVAG